MASKAPDQTIKQFQSSMVLHLKNVYNRHASPDGYWKKEHIENFVNIVQQQRGLMPAWLAAKESLDFNGFLKYMASTEAKLVAPARDEILSQPLTSYFINSSHNTYLQGNQLSSKSSAQTYTAVLKRGCRCVEVDVWDASDDDLSSEEDTSDSSDEEDLVSTDVGSEKKKNKFSIFFLKKRLKKISNDTDDASKASKKAKKKIKKEKVKKMIESRFPAPPGVIEPKVYHGYTITKPVSFRRVCVAILDDAFTASDLPLIVSLEVHCGPEQQEQMVKIMKQIFDGFLLEPPEETTSVLPPPEALKNKILIKVKYAPYVTGGEEQAAEEGQTDDDEVQPPSGKKAKPSKIIHALSDMGIYTRGISFKSFKGSDASMPTHIFSLSEKKVLDVEPTELWEHNKKYLMRTYPAGTRVTSSNFNPVPRWNRGIQIVALNWQEYDDSMMLNDAMFAGSKGYILKPQGFHPNDSSLPKANVLDLSIIVFAAQDLLLPEEDDDAKGFEPYVKVELHHDQPYGYSVISSSEDKKDEYKCRTKERDGIHPNFKAQVLEFKNVPGVVKELTFVRFTVKDDELGRDDLSTWACIRLDRLQEGYRFVHLLDPLGRETDAVLLIKVTKRLK